MYFPQHIWPKTSGHLSFMWIQGRKNPSSEIFPTTERLKERLSVNFAMIYITIIW